MSVDSHDVLSFKSLIDDEYMVIVVYPESVHYGRFKSLIESVNGGIAALATEHKAIIVDGVELEEISSDQFKAVQAHEICHGVLKHGSGPIEIEEIEADLTAIDLLIKIGEHKASEALRERLREQRGIEYNEKSLSSNLSPQSLDLYNQYRSRF